MKFAIFALRCLSASALVFVFPTITAQAETGVPAGVEDMLRQAASVPDTSAFEATKKLAIRTFPKQEAAIKALVRRIKDEQAQATRRDQEQAARRLLAGWKGVGEAGATLSTGNGREKNLALGLTVSKETVKWRHRLSLAADIRSVGDARTKERLALSYNPSYLFSPSFYAAAFFGWERDARAGYRARFTETLGIGHTVIDDENRRFEIEAGPGLRHIRLDAAEARSRTAEEFVFRAAAKFRYEIDESLAFTQTVLGLAGSDNRSFETASALTTKINGELSSRLSFTLRNESDPPAGRKATDTLSRVTLVYDF